MKTTIFIVLLLFISSIWTIDDDLQSNVDNLKNLISASETIIDKIDDVALLKDQLPLATSLISSFSSEETLYTTIKADDEFADIDADDATIFTNFFTDIDTKKAKYQQIIDLANAFIAADYYISGSEKISDFDSFLELLETINDNNNDDSEITTCVSLYALIKDLSTEDQATFVSIQNTAQTAQETIEKLNQSLERSFTVTDQSSVSESIQSALKTLVDMKSNLTEDSNLYKAFELLYSSMETEYTEITSKIEEYNNLTDEEKAEAEEQIIEELESEIGEKQENFSNLDAEDKEELAEEQTDLRKALSDQIAEIKEEATSSDASEEVQQQYEELATQYKELIANGTDQVKQQIALMTEEDANVSDSFQQALDLIKSVASEEDDSEFVDEKELKLELLDEALSEYANLEKDESTISNMAEIFNVISTDDTNSTFMAKIVNVLSDENATLASSSDRTQSQEMISLLQTKIKEDISANETISEDDLVSYKEQAQAALQNVEKSLLNTDISGDYENEVYSDDDIKVTRTAVSSENFSEKFEEILSESQSTIGVGMEMSDSVKEQISEKIAEKVGDFSNKNILITQQMSNSSISSEFSDSEEKVSETFEFKITALNDEGEVEEIDLSGLDEGVAIKITMKDNVNITEYSVNKFQCKYFNETTNTWETDSDLTLESISEDEAECITTHFTEFTITTSSSTSFSSYLMAFGILNLISLIFIF